MPQPEGSAPLALHAVHEHVVVLAYEADPDLLAELVPEGTEPDDFHGHGLVLVVGARLSRLRVGRLPVPGPAAHASLSVRIPARRERGGEIQRAAVILQEVVPPGAASWATRLVTSRGSLVRPMGGTTGGPPAGRMGARYEWLSLSRWMSAEAWARGTPEPVSLDPHAAFVAERRLIWRRARDGSWRETVLARPEWRYVAAEESRLDWPSPQGVHPVIARGLQAGRPFSAFVFDGSAVTASWPRRLA